MTQPRVDPVALEQYLDDELAIASDPSIDPGYAEFVTLLDARYDDPRFLLPTVDSLNSVTADDIDRVYRDRFGDASDFSFSFSGDFDLDEAIELSRRYLGTLPSTGRVESVDYVEPAAAGRDRRRAVTAGEGEQASVALLFTAPATADRRDDIVAAILQEVVTARLTDVVREELGDSYSPFAFVQITDGGAPNAETYISNTTAPELLDEVVAAVTAATRRPASVRARATPSSQRRARTSASSSTCSATSRSTTRCCRCSPTRPATHRSTSSSTRPRWVEVIAADEIRDAARALAPRRPVHRSPRPPADPSVCTAVRQRMLAGVTVRWLTSTSSPPRTS